MSFISGVSLADIDPRSRDNEMHGLFFTPFKSHTQEKHIVASICEIGEHFFALQDISK